MAASSARHGGIAPTGHRTKVQATAITTIWRTSAVDRITRQKRTPFPRRTVFGPSPLTTVRFHPSCPPKGKPPAVNVTGFQKTVPAYTQAGARAIKPVNNPIFTSTAPEPPMPPPQPPNAPTRPALQPRSIRPKQENTSPSRLIPVECRVCGRRKCG